MHSLLPKMPWVCDSWSQGSKEQELNPCSCSLNPGLWLDGNLWSGVNSKEAITTDSHVLTQV